MAEVEVIRINTGVWEPVPSVGSLMEMFSVALLYIDVSVCSSLVYNFI